MKLHWAKLTSELIFANDISTIFSENSKYTSNVQNVLLNIFTLRRKRIVRQHGFHAYVTVPICVVLYRHEQQYV